MTFRNPVERFKNEPQNTCTQLIPVTRSKCHTFFFYLRLVLVVFFRFVSEHLSLVSLT